MEINALLSGDIDKNSVFVTGGFYNSLNNTVTWDQSNDSVFESISPGENGSVTFKFTSLDSINTSLLNPEVIIDVSVNGRRLSESNVSEEIISSVSRKIRFNTNLSLVPRIIYSSGPITNSGPIPPVAELTTTYTVVWTLGNSVNDASDVVVSTKLPLYVSWTGKTNPNSEDVTYNSTNREVTWNVGAIKVLSGSSSSPREVYFQIELLPSISQINQTPILIRETKTTGKDEFTGAILNSSRRELTTKISTDPSYKNGDEKVIGN